MDELKRRNVFRVGIAYAVSAWVVLQVVDLVLDNTEAPAWVMDVIMILALLGFFVALVISWAYELTPEGIKRERDVKNGESITHQTSRKLNQITLAALGLVVIFFLVDRFVLDAPDSSPGLANTDQSSELAISTEPVLESPQELDPGVAVLPFDNLSEDPNNAFFAGGMHEDVLTHLSRIAGLRVISRTSMIRIAERGLDVREIGRQLGVSHVLEGSVRRAGEQVRVTVQLIDAATDQHLWAENFDRKLDDIFAIQSEIAQSIAAQLETELSPQEVSLLAEAPTDNLEAYELYMQARELNRTWSFAEGFKKQRVLLEEAVALAPDFLAAQAMLAAAYGRLVWVGADPGGVFREKAKIVTDFIEQSWPERPEATLARARYIYTVERDYEKALELYMAVLPSMPNNAELLMSIASCHKRLHQFEQGLVMINRAESLDPEYATIAGEKGFHLIGTGRIDEAMEHYRASAERFPEDVSNLSSWATFTLTMKGDLKTYLALWDRIEAMDPAAALTNEQLLRIRSDGKNPDFVIAELDKLKSDNSWSNMDINIQVAELLNLAGREDESTDRARLALSALETTLSSGEPLPGNTPKAYYSTFAYWACLAGDMGAFNRFRAVADAIKPSELGMAGVANTQMMRAVAECGDAATAWSMRNDVQPGLLGLTRWDLVLDPIYTHYFSDLPAYRAWVAEKDTQPVQ